MEEVKKNQEALKAEIDRVEGRARERPRRFLRPPGEGGYDEESQEEMREMLRTLMRQNRRLAERVDYLLQMLAEAAESTAEEDMEKMLTTIAQAQVSVLEQIGKVSEVKPEGITKAQEEAFRVLADKLDQLRNAISTLPYSQQMDVLKNDMASISSEIKTLESAVTKSPEQVAATVSLLKEDLAGLRGRLEQISADVKSVKPGMDEVAVMARQITPALNKVSGIEEKLASLEAKLGEIPAATVSQIAQKLDSIEAEIRKISLAAPSGSVEQAAELKAALDSLRAELPAAGGQGIRERISGIEEKISSLAGAGEKLTAIEAKLSAVEETLKMPGAASLAELRSEFDDIKRMIASAKEHPGLEEKIGEFEERLSAVASLENKISTLQADIARLEKEMQAYPTHRVEEFVAAKQELEKIKEEAPEHPVVAAMEERVQALEAPAGEAAEGKRKAALSRGKIIIIVIAAAALAVAGVLLFVKF